MAFEIKVGSDNATRQLDALEKRIDAVVLALGKFGATPGLDAFLQKITSFRGFEAGAVNSINALAQAMGGLQNASGNIQNITAALQRLGLTNFASVAANVQQFARALASIQVPANIASLANALNTISAASNNAAGSVARLNQQLTQSSTAAQGLQQAAAGMNNVGGASRQAAGGMMAFGSSAQITSGILTAMGISSVIQGLRDFVKEAYDASVKMDSFRVSMRMATGSNEGAAKSFEYLKSVASATGQSVETLMDPFRKFMQAATSAGYATDQAQAVFTKFSAVFRTFGLTSEQTKRSFTALEQMMAKGTVSMEELRQQLGENVPAFSMLAKAMGVNEAQLSKMIANGQVGSSVLGKLADTMFDVANKSGAFAEALQKPQAQMAAWQSKVFQFSAAFGEAFIQPVLQGLNALEKAFGSTESMIEFGKTLGFIAGFALSSILHSVAAVVASLKWLVSGFNDVKFVAQMTGIYFATLGQTIVQTAVQIGQAIQLLVTGISTLNFDVMAQGVEKLTASVTNFGTNWSKNWINAADPVMKARNATDDAGKSMNQTTNAGKDLTGTIGSLTKANGSASSSFQSTASSANSAASSFSNAAGAARDYAAAVASIPATRDPYSMRMDGGAGSMKVKPSVEVDEYSSYYQDYTYQQGATSGMTGTDLMGDDYGVYSYKTGGIAGTGKTTRMPASLFHNAPHFAQGGLSDGGIPSILHPNEAVIPLQGGGVPVNLNLNGGGSRIDPYQIRMLTVMYETSQGIKDVRQQSIDNTVLLINEFAKSQALQRETNSLLGQVRSAIGNIKMSSSSSSSGSAVDTTRPTGSGSAGSQAGQQFGNGNKVQDRDSGTWYRTVSPMYEGGGTYMQVNGQYGWWKQTTAPGEIQDGGSGFATGSPNASKDLSGGFQATLHPDEAVIPLPDGRAVPVDMRNFDFSAMFDRYRDGGQQSPARTVAPTVNAGGVTQNIKATITVITKDADSFRASKNQIAQDLAAEIARATKIVGTKSAIDDPTKRPE